jgi:Domain of unknown function (DUF4349)
MKRLRLWVLAIFVLATLISCSDFSATDTTTTPRSEEAKPSADLNQREKDIRPAEAAEPAQRLALRDRKLIHEGEVSLQVKDLDAARTELEARVAAAGGFVANVDHERFDGGLNLSLVLRLPTATFGNFVRALDALGHVQRESVQVLDVTDQWVDLERRIATNEKLAARLEQLIDQKSYQFRDLLAVEQKLSELRLEIERLQAARLGLDDRIALSTLRIQMHQETAIKIAPPGGVLAPLSNAVENAGLRLRASARAMMSVLALMVTLFVVALPWLAASALVALVLAFFLRLARRKKDVTPPSR